MAYTSAGFTDTQDNQKSFNEKYVDSDPGPYIGTVKVTNDPLRMGRLGVNIPALSKTTNPTASQIIWCQYLSPFYGAKSINAVSSSDPFSYKTTQHSYGMWAVPPDVDTDVLVIFAKGEQSNATAFWIGCVQKPLVNQQVPANGSSSRTEYSGSTNRERAISRQESYGTDFLPAGEKNQKRYQDGETLSNLAKWRYPINDRLADQLNAQGLVQDEIRGTTSSSARRESPSRVFGLNTPGRIRSDSRELNIGLDNTKVKTDRDPGHSFVMDDGDLNGNNQLTRLRTASGHQLLMHDTEGVVYLANGSGKAFIEMASDGTISVYSANGIDFRSGTDFNLHSDTNIHFHAKGNINFTAEQSVNLNADRNVHTMAKEAIRVSSQGTLQTYAKTNIKSYSDGPQMHGSGNRIDISGSEVHMNSQLARKGWGPSWLVPEHDLVRIKVTGGPGGFIDIDDSKPIVRGRINKKDNKTTVTDFVTHEPYDRNSSQARKKKLINEAIEEIRKSNPEMSASDIQQIKTELLKQPSVKAVADKLTKVVKLNDKIKLPIQDLNTLVSKAAELQQLIDDPKAAAMNFVYGKIEEVKGQVTAEARSLANRAIENVKSFFRF